MPRIKALHERKFAGKPLKGLKLYYDPFGQNEMCVELAFTDGEIASVCIGPGRPQIISAAVCYEPESSAAKNEEKEDGNCSRSDLEAGDNGQSLGRARSTGDDLRGRQAALVAPAMTSAVDTPYPCRSTVISVNDAGSTTNLREMNDVNGYSEYLRNLGPSIFDTPGDGTLVRPSTASSPNGNDTASPRPRR